MRTFYTTFKKCDSLRHELSWTHYRLLMKVNDEQARSFYIDECIKAQWSSRQLERQINSFYYQRILASQDKAEVAEEIKQLEEELRRELNLDDFYKLE